MSEQVFLLGPSEHIRFNNPWHLTCTLILRYTYTHTHAQAPTHIHSPSTQREQLNGPEHIVALTFCASYPSQSSKPWQLTLLAFCHGALACTVAGGGRQRGGEQNDKKKIFSSTLFLKWSDCEQGLEEAESRLVGAPSSRGHYVQQIIRVWRGGTRHGTHNLQPPSPLNQSPPVLAEALAVSKWPDLDQLLLISTCIMASVWLLDAKMDEDISFCPLSIFSLSHCWFLGKHRISPVTLGFIICVKQFICCPFSE